MPYNLFISHSWKYSNDYDRLVEKLKGYSYFTFKNYSVPSKDPIDINGNYYKKKLREAIENQMRLCSIIVVIAGKYTSYSDSIDMELDVAIEMGKPILAIEPWGSIATSQRAKNVADEIVAWNTESIVKAIRRLSI